MKNYLLLVVLLIIGANNIYSQSWNALNTGTTTDEYWALDFANDNVGYVVGNDVADDGLILKTIDGGVTWQSSLSGYSVIFSAIDVISADTVFVTGQSGVILKTVDGGTNWNLLNTGIIPNLISIQFINSAIGFAGAYGNMYKTTDGGISWVDISIQFAQNIYRFQFLNQLDGYALACSSNKIYKTTDGGNTWILGYNGLVAGSCVKGMFFLDNQTGYIAHGGQITSTVNGAQNWSVNTPASFGSAGMSGLYFFNSQEGWAAPMNQLNTIYHTLDGGQTWTNLTVPGCGGFTDMCFPSNSTGYASSYNGRIFKLETTVSVKEKDKDASFKIYPNPASNQLKIDTELNVKKISILDITGKTIISFTSNNIKTINVEKLLSGIYFLKLTTQDSSFTKKFVKD